MGFFCCVICSPRGLCSQSRHSVSAGTVMVIVLHLHESAGYFLSSFPQRFLLCSQSGARYMFSEWSLPQLCVCAWELITLMSPLWGNVVFVEPLLHISASMGMCSQQRTLYIFPEWFPLQLYVCTSKLITHATVMDRQFCLAKHRQACLWTLRDTAAVAEMLPSDSCA